MYHLDVAGWVQIFCFILHFAFKAIYLQNELLLKKIDSFSIRKIVKYYFLMA